ncbi:MAG: NAD(P)H-binding protein [Planctomycetota bacterium]
MKTVFVAGATGLVGSQVARILDTKGHRVIALVRDSSKRIEGVSENVRYVQGDLRSPHLFAGELKGVDVVVSSANGIIPESRGVNAERVNDSYEAFITACEAAGVDRFVQSSVPSHRIESTVPELGGKRAIEEWLRASAMQSFVVRNPAFMDTWLVMNGFREAENRDAAATTKREFGFMKRWLWMVGNLASKHGFFIAPGGASHGSVLIASRDVAEMMAACVDHETYDDLLIEAGGPQWVSWREIADIIAARVGRPRLRIIPLPAWTARMLQLAATPFSPPVANVFGLIRLVAKWQPRWDSKPTVELLNLPPQWTVSDYLDAQTSPPTTTSDRTSARTSSQLVSM